MNATMDTTVVGLFDSFEQARRVQQELLSAGFAAADVRVVSQYDEQYNVRRDEDKGFWESLKQAFGFGDDDEDYHYYREGARRGGVLVTVNASGNRADQAVTIMRRHGVVDIDRRAQEWKRSGWTGYQASAGHLTAEQLRAERARYQQAGQTQTLEADQKVAVPVIEEELAAGKRRVERGGVRIHRRVTERPVEAQVRVREERVNVERHAANRELRPGEVEQAFTEKVIEAREMAEEPVVQKKTRVTGEVMVNKEAEERTETVRDTVRKSDVEVERIPGKTTTSRTETQRTQSGAAANRGTSDKD
jgi:stress response protein YsnF